MRVPLTWLREYVETDASAEQIARRLAISALEVDRVIDMGVEDAAGNLDAFLVGKVLEAGKHPNADKLQLCRVDVGEGEPRQIVCGAWNFGAGATVAVALPGARLPGADEPLAEVKLRGELSRGMILSERELKLGTDHSGVIVFDAGPEPGTPLVDALPIREQVLEVTPTLNRVDLLSVYGIAREVSALLGGELRPMPGQDPPILHPEWVDVRIDDAEGCPRYIGRVFRKVLVGPSPLWLRARMHFAGMRAISNIVDITNYVMHALGSPIHAFDREKLHDGRIVVRRAERGEEVRTLDGQLRRLDERDLLIADADRAVALAGIMGGLETEVSDGTSEVLLEAANFEAISLLKTSERLGLRTDGSNRWEKGVDPHLAEPAAVFASQLIVELTGAELTGSADVHGDLPARPVVRLRPERADRVIGLSVPAEKQRGLLERLGFEVTDDWDVTVPSWRARDVWREVDLIEEVARAVLDDVPLTVPLRRHVQGRLSKDQRLRRVVEDVLVGAGFSEAYTWSLQPDDPAEDAIRLPDPMTSEQAVLRTTLVSGLIEAARTNVDAANEEIALFEIARVYLPDGGGLPNERLLVGGVVEGGFSAVKGAVEAVYGALHLEPDPARAVHPLLHPGKAARLGAGWVGELHPTLLEGEWGAFELDLATLFEPVPERIVYEDVITYPALRQDIAVVVPENVEAGTLVEVAREAAGDELREAHVFDVYRGGQVGPGQKSVALRLSFQSPERTLSDDDAATLRGRIVQALAERFGAELRA